jgi:hypothetical protein
MQTLQDCSFAFVRLSLRAAQLRDHGADPLQSLVDHREIGEEELHIDRRDVAERIDRSFWMRDRWIVKGSDDMDERTGLLENPEQAPTESSLMDSLGQTSDIPVLDLRWHSPAWSEKPCEFVESRVRHFDRGQVRFVLGTTEGSGRRL